MTAKAAEKGIFLARVTANVPLCREHYKLVLTVEGFPPARPGQFVQLQCSPPSEMGWQGGPLTRRPFSIGGLRRCGDTCELDILHRALGRGTRWLAGLKVGEPVSILGPLGKAFEIGSRPTAYLVGGGIGLPPLIWLAEALQAAGKQIIAFVGARSSELLPLTRVPEVPIVAGEPSLSYGEFAAFGVPVVLATDDGSLGISGTVTDALRQFLQCSNCEVASGAARPAGNHEQNANLVVYSCGPEAMMHAVASICEPRHILCQVSMERSMACGMGTCQSCVLPVRDASADAGWRFKLCCTDGPVFDSRAIIWE